VGSKVSTTCTLMHRVRSHPGGSPDALMVTVVTPPPQDVGDGFPMRNRSGMAVPGADAAVPLAVICRVGTSPTHLREYGGLGQGKAGGLWQRGKWDGGFGHGEGEGEGERGRGVKGRSGILRGGGGEARPRVMA
jgi:hypothetical protein